VDRAETVQQLRDQRRKNRRAQNRSDILNAAEMVFAQDGIRDGSIRKIAEESGFSAASIYLFFDNKEDLVSQVLSTRGDELIAVIRSVAESKSDPVAKLHRVIDETMVFFRDRPNFRFLLHHVRGGPTITGPVLPESADPGSDRFHEAMAMLSAMIRAGQLDGSIRDGDASVLAHFYSVLINEFVLLEEGASPSQGGAFSVHQFHELVDDAFRARNS
jgi:AcrR family transcriptional regulator